MRNGFRCLRTKCKRSLGGQGSGVWRLVAPVAIAFLAACGGGDPESEPSQSPGPTALPVNSSGVKLTLKAGVLQVPADVSVAAVGDSTLELTPPQASLTVGTVFTARDRPYVVLSTSSSPAMQTLSVRTATPDEVIESLEIDGDLDVRTLDLSRAVARTSDGSRGLVLQGAGHMKSDQDAPGKGWQGACAGAAATTKNTVNISCSIDYTTEDEAAKFGGSVEFANLSVTKMRYSFASPTAMAASMEADVQGALEMTLFPAKGDPEKSWAGTRVLVRVEIPIPGTLGFGSVRLPYALEYKVPLPPLQVRVNFAAKLAAGKLSDETASIVVSAGSYEPSKDEFTVALPGYSRVVVGVEIAATKRIAALGLAVLPDSDNDLATAGVFAKVGPSGVFGWKWRARDALNCKQVDLSNEWYFAVGANTALSGIVGAGLSYDYRIKADSFKRDFGNCLDQLLFDPSAIGFSPGLPFNVRKLLKAVKVGGEQMDVPSNLIYSVAPSDGATINQDSGDITLDRAATYVVTAQTVAGLKSNPLTAITTSVATLAISPATLELLPRQTAQLTVVARDTGGNPVALPAGLVWASTNPAVATVTSAGMVTAQSIGSASVTVTDSIAQIEATASIQVVAPSTQYAYSFGVSGIPCGGSEGAATVIVSGNSQSFTYNYQVGPTPQCVFGQPGSYGTFERRVPIPLAPGARYTATLTAQLPRMLGVSANFSIEAFNSSGIPVAPAPVGLHVGRDTLGGQNSVTFTAPVLP